MIRSIMPPEQWLLDLRREVCEAVDRAVAACAAAAAAAPAAPAASQSLGPPATMLSNRERQVAALVAEGHTNRQIAARLFIAQRTVESHVQHILTKLDFSSRAQIARWHAAGGR